MIIDAQLTVSNQQAVTTTAASTNYIDLQTARTIGVGEPMYWVVLTTTALAGAGAQVVVTVEASADAAFTSPVTAQTLGTFAPLSGAGVLMIHRLSLNGITLQYVRLKYTVSGGTLTAGAFTGTLTHDVDAYTAYPENFVIHG